MFVHARSFGPLLPSHPRYYVFNSFQTVYLFKIVQYFKVLSLNYIAFERFIGMDTFQDSSVGLSDL